MGKKEETKEESVEEEMKRGINKKASPILIAGVVVLVAGILVIGAWPLWNFAIVPGKLILDDDPAVYKNDIEFEGTLGLLNFSTLQLNVYPDARGVKRIQLNSSDETHLNIYSNITVYDKNSSFQIVLKHSNKKINRENYKEEYGGKERDYWFPLNTERKDYRIPNVFIESHLSTYYFEAEEKRADLDCYRYSCSEKGLEYGMDGTTGEPVLMDFEEVVWIFPRTGSTIDQYYKITMSLPMPVPSSNLTDDQDIQMVPAVYVEAQYTQDQITGSGKDAKERANSLDLLTVTIPMAIVIIGLILIIIAIIMVVIGRKK